MTWRAGWPSGLEYDRRNRRAIEGRYPYLDSDTRGVLGKEPRSVPNRTPFQN